MAAGKRKRPITYGKQKSRLRSSSYSDYDMGWFPGTDKIDHSQKPPALPANKPTSQKAATMPVEPEDEVVNQLMDFTSLPRSQAIRYLKVGPTRTIGQRVLSIS